MYWLALDLALALALLSAQRSEFIADVYFLFS